MFETVDRYILEFSMPLAGWGPDAPTDGTGRMNGKIFRAGEPRTRNGTVWLVNDVISP